MLKKISNPGNSKPQQDTLIYGIEYLKFKKLIKKKVRKEKLTISRIFTRI